jgi:LysM repeat protein
MPCYLSPNFQGFHKRLTVLIDRRRGLMIRPLKFFGMGMAIRFLGLVFFKKGWTEEKYTVKPGDTLNGIAKSFGLHIEAIKKANALQGDSIKPKQILILPSPKEAKSDETARKSLGGARQRLSTETVKKMSVKREAYSVQKGESLISISKKVGLSIEEIKRINHLRTTTLKIGQVLFLNDECLWDEEKEELEDGEMIVEPSQTEGEKGEEIASNALGTWNNPEERNLLVRVVKTFLGVPYQLGGSTLKGIDCSAFVKKIYEIFNIRLPRTAREQLSIGKKVERDQLEEGDLVFFKRPGNNAHVGIYIGDNQFVHASSRNKEVKIDQSDIPYFHTRFIRGVRVKELERES